ncbi:uncharacterized protein LOC114360950 [Ostrinia furnacalis]|uniref:uncharacterized protein LOC114360950 n=1 Tax=Ostrinia furnacalis TaxID=93504 RepID=UPI00103BF02E|nr:uncharacterized protein LOC114360950 [Ostrinia furnacalis]
MPKRRHGDTIEYLASKLKKLEKKMKHSKRRTTLSESSTSTSSSESSPASSRSSSPAPQTLLALSQDRNQRKEASSMGPDPAMPIPASVNEPVAGTSDSVPATQPQEAASVEVTQTPASLDTGLDPEILDILGIDPTATVEYGPNINEELANRLNYMATSGLDKDTRKELLQKYLVPANCKNLSAPQMNPEIKAATPEYVQKRDKSIEINQKEIAAAITCVGQIINAQINNPARDNELVKSLMDVGRILCDVQYLQSSSRRNHALYSLKKELREQLASTKIDGYLFGQNLTETLKTAKAVSKSSSDLKADSAKKPKQDKNLNRKSGTGNRRAAPGPPRHQPPAARATTSYQPPPPPPPQPARGHYSTASSYRRRETRRR